MSARPFNHPSPVRSSLRVKRLTVGYDSGAPVLTQLTFTAQSGRLTAVVGANGSGKSTLLRALVGLIPLTEGQIELDGQSLQYWLASSQVGFVPQQLSTIETVAITASEFIGLSLVACREHARQDEKTVRQTAEWLEITQLLTQPLRDLSGGQLRRVLLARALVHRPRILLLDEPEAGLDAAAQKLLVQRLQEYAQQAQAVVIVATHAHDLFATAAHQVIELQGAA